MIFLNGIWFRQIQRFIKYMVTNTSDNIQKHIKLFLLKLLKLLPYNIYDIVLQTIKKPLTLAIEDKYRNIPIENLNLAGVTNLLKTYMLTSKNKDRRYYEFCNLLEKFDFKQEADILSSTKPHEIVLKRELEKHLHDHEVILDTRTEEVPLVAVIITYYNDGSEIINNLKRFFRQTLYVQGKCEFIIVDSNSPKREYRLIKEHFSSYPNILCVKTNYREKLYAAWNRGVFLARADILSFTSTNDFLINDALNLLYHEIVKDDDIVWVHGDCDWEDGKPYLRCHSDNYTISMLFNPSFMIFTAQLIRKKIFIDMGGFNPTFQIAGDTDFKIRLSQAYGDRIKHLNIPLAIQNYIKPEAMSNHPRAEIECYRACQPYREAKHLQKLFCDRFPSYRAGEYLAAIGFSSLHWRNPYYNVYNKFYSNSPLALDCFKAAVSLGYSNPIITSNIKYLKPLTELYYNLQQERLMSKRLLIAIKIQLLKNKLLDSIGNKASHNISERYYNSYYWCIW